MKKYNQYNFYAICSSIIGFLLIIWLIYQFNNRDKHNFTKNYEQILFLINEIVLCTKDNNEEAIMTLLEKYDYYQIVHIPTNAIITRNHQAENFHFIFFEAPDIEGFSLEVDGKKISAITEKHQTLNSYVIPCLLFVLIILVGIIVYLFRQINTQYLLLSKAIRGFVAGDFAIDQKLSNPTREKMRRISTLIRSREFVLRTIGHELSATITKMKLLIGLPSLQRLNQEDINSLRKYITELHAISDNMFKFERALSFNTQLDCQSFSSETLLLESLKKFEDEKMNIFLKSDSIFIIYGDLSMLCIALGNLIHNALKYSINRQIGIEVMQNQITIYNIGHSLQHDITYYLQPFSRDRKHFQTTGYGLGLYIVSEVLKLHNITLSYRFEYAGFDEKSNKFLQNLQISTRETNKKDLGIHAFDILFK
ncbi:hypothetical protein CQA66_01650 [Helicobacter aurati]|uniref:histidine kinase n=1 Tax=Helicobacter aurati TaxID=137778 RepID=A0A3D8J894_9HELI|nr:HAMP domain-containing sensor histidine kinase [Helicobacter aurati]RDU73395.1 hypothetical protein CQA66_01650 [Helicobacter aurati]